ncbi:MAG: ATP-binding protein [Desulfosporosinus sp.]|nr:ATP-binding protein [Desulfosporosinus sp.]
MSPNGCLTINTFMEGQNIVLSFRDEGTGIDPEHIAKLGTPFFTTKEGGTGLGLPLCYNIANRHKAQIEVKTGLDGTTFLVRFPKPKWE